MCEWAVIQCYSNQEKRVAESLKKRIDIETFLPLMRTMFISRGKIVFRVRPLFPGYLFYINDKSINLFSLTRFVEGVIRVLRRSDEQPALISENFIETIAARMDRDGLFIIPRKPTKEKKQYHKGQVVRVKSGALSLNSLDLIVDSMSSEDRINVLWDVLGCERVVAISRDQLEDV